MAAYKLQHLSERPHGSSKYESKKKMGLKSKRESATMSFFQRFAKTTAGSGGATEIDVASMDHSYAKCWTSHPETSHAKAAKYIFMSSQSVKQSNSTSMNDDETIDVESVDAAENLPYDTSKAHYLMSECERHVQMARPSGLTLMGVSEVEETISRSGWTATQSKFFNRAYKPILANRLARLANANQLNEPILRRVHIDKASKRMRQAFSSVFWDSKLLMWLHSVLMDNLSLTMLSIYLDILQTLKAKSPVAIDRMITLSNNWKRTTDAGHEALNLLLKRPWDPVMSTIAQYKANKLPGSPVILVVPSLPQNFSTHQHHNVTKNERENFWNSQLSNMGKVVYINPSRLDNTNSTSSQMVEQMISLVVNKIAEIRQSSPKRVIVLVGWCFGALLAAYVANIEKVSVLVTLGYPLIGMNGLRADVDDFILESSTPTLFVIGEHATTCPIEDLEDMREKMIAENSLVVVGGANDELNVSFKKKKDEGVTQAVVDRCIQDEIWEFLGSTLSAVISSQENLEAGLKKRKKRPSPEVSEPADQTGIIKEEIAGGVKQLELRLNTTPLIKKKKKGEIKEKKTKKSANTPKKNPLSRVSSAPAQLTTGAIFPSQQDSLRFGIPPTFKQAQKPTSLPIQKLTIPASTKESNQPLASQTTQSIGRTKQLEPQTSVSRTVNTLEQRVVYPGKDTLIQLTGHRGQKYAMTAEKARELFGLQLSTDRSHSNDLVKRGFETTKQLLTLPPDTLRNMERVSPQKPVLSAIQPSTTSAESSSVILPLSETEQSNTSELSSNQIRQLLTLEGTTFLVASPLKNKQTSQETVSVSRAGQSLVTGRLFANTISTTASVFSTTTKLSATENASLDVNKAIDKAVTEDCKETLDFVQPDVDALVATPPDTQEEPEAVQSPGPIPTTVDDVERVSL